MVCIQVANKSDNKSHKFDTVVDTILGRLFELLKSQIDATHYAFLFVL